MHLIMLTTSDGKKVFINPKNIVSMLQPTNTKTTSVNYKHGGLFIVNETPEQITKLIQELNQR